MNYKFALELLPLFSSRSLPETVSRHINFDVDTETHALLQPNKTVHSSRIFGWLNRIGI